MKKQGDYEGSRREIMRKSGSRVSRLKRQEVRTRDDKNLSRHESFSEYVARRDAEELSKISG